VFTETWEFFLKFVYKNALFGVIEDEAVKVSHA